MDGFAIVVVGASAGGVEAVSAFVRGLPADIPAAVFVTVHFPPDSTSVLPAILERVGALPATHASDGERIHPGRIYVAPPDRHLLVGPRIVRVVRGPRENGNRPAVDPMFRSAAAAYRARVIGVVLSGTLDDGTSGLLAVTRNGGRGLAQSPSEATFPAMPQSAIDYGGVEETAPVAELGRMVDRLAREIARAPIGPAAATEDAMDEPERDETAYSSLDLDAIEDSASHPGRVAPFGCPDCGGVLWQIDEGELIRFRCRVGHAWSADALAAEQGETLDAALWTALRALEEKAALSRQVAARLRRRGLDALARRHDRSESTAKRRAGIIRDVLLAGSAPAARDAGPEAAVEARERTRRARGDDESTADTARAAADD